MARWVFSDDPTVWLNWIQGLTAIGLAVLTAIYVRLTSRVSQSAVRQADAAVLQAAAAMEASRLAARQLDTALLEAYLPVQSAVGAALGHLRAFKELKPISVPYNFVPPNFARGVEASERIGGALSSTLRTAAVLLSQAQSNHEHLITKIPNEPGSAFYDYYTGTIQLTVDALEQMLQAVYDEIEPIVGQLRLSTGRSDRTFEKLNVTTIADKNSA